MPPYHYDMKGQERIAGDIECVSPYADQPIPTNREILKDIPPIKYFDDDEHSANNISLYG